MTHKPYHLDIDLLIARLKAIFAKAFDRPEPKPKPEPMPAPSIAQTVLDLSGTEGFDDNGDDFDILREALTAADLVGTLADENADFTVDAGFDLTTVLVIVVLFILARVFKHGAQMRDDLEGTV